MEPTRDETDAATEVTQTPSLPALTIQAGDQAYTVEPADAPITIGREFPAQVQIDNAAISRRHVRIEPGDDHWTAVDDGSLNGVFVDGIRQTSIAISDGLTIRLGSPEGIPVSFSLTRPSARPETVRGALPADSDEGDDDEDVDWTAEGESTDPGVVRAGAAVAARRRELNLSQRTLAREKIMNAGALIAFEKGRSWPRQAKLAKLEQVLQWPAGTITRLRYGQHEPDDGERTDVLTNTVQAPYMAQAAEVALDTIKTQIESLPDPSDAEFTGRVTRVLADLRKLETVAANAARSANGVPDVVMVLSAVRKTYRDLMLRAARSPHATLGQRLYAARHRAELTIEEAANAAGTSPDVIIAAEADTPLSGDADAAARSLLEALTRR